MLRIWDLRRGDDDDNRSSPYGGGFRSLVIPTLLEFNYLKAPLAFLALVIGPAILVGIAPSVVVTYGRLAYHTLTLAGTNLAVALGLFVLLRTVTERFAGSSITPEQLGRSRKMGTIVAALLFAGGGLALAGVVEFSEGLKL